jgi:hypothetical protein
MPATAVATARRKTDQPGLCERLAREDRLILAAFARRVALARQLREDLALCRPAEPELNGLSDRTLRELLGLVTTLTKREVARGKTQHR